MTTQFLTFFLLLSCFALTSIAQEDAVFGRPADPKLLGVSKKEKFSHFRFYWHDLVSGSNPTAIQVLPAIPKYNTTSYFGFARIIYNALTLGPEATSKLVGRAEGVYVGTSQIQLEMLMVQNLAFFEGRYNGSSLTIVGRNVAFDKVRELPIVGGSGLFRYARGYAQINTYSFDPKSGDGVIEYNLYVYHY